MNSELEKKLGTLRACGASPKQTLSKLTESERTEVYKVGITSLFEQLLKNGTV